MEIRENVEGQMRVDMMDREKRGWGECQYPWLAPVGRVGVLRDLRLLHKLVRGGTFQSLRQDDTIKSEIILTLWNFTGKDQVWEVAY